MAKKGIVGLYVDADMREVTRAASFMENFFKEMSTEAHLSTVTTATHAVFSDRFDAHMSLVASTAKAKFFHVYEYSPSPDPYSWVGVRSKKLWMHDRQGMGSSLTFSWRWLPANNYNPTYQQRRNSTVGRDGIRAISDDEFSTLLLKSKDRRHKFIWKAPMLETGITRRVYAQPGGKLFMPFNDGTIAFNHFALVNEQAPGPTRGNFVQQWTKFWRVTVPAQWDEVIGEEIERDATRRINAALAAGKTRPRKRMRRFEFSAITDTKIANRQGKEQAIAALRGHKRSIKGIESVRGEFTDFG